MPEVMTDTAQKQRANITLLDEDVALIEQIKDAVEKRLEMKVPRAFIVKMALRELAAIELKSS